MGRFLNSKCYSTSMKVTVMKPRFKPRDYEDFVLYPYQVFHIKLHYKRLGLKEKVINYFGYVDLYRFGIERGDSFIETDEWNVNEKNVMTPIVEDYEKIREFAMKKAVEWGALRIVSWWHPLVEVVKDMRAYKIFWIYTINGERYLMDAFNGQEYKMSEILKILNKTKKEKFKG